LKVADESALLARQHAQRAEASANENHERLVRLNVANGVKLLDEGDHFNALLWFAEAFKLEESRHDRTANHRLRLAATLQMSPRLLHLWFAGRPETRAGFSQDGRLVLSVSQNGATCAWDAVSGQPVTAPLALDRPGALVGWLDRFSPEGRHVLGVETNGVWLREVSSGARLQRLPHPLVRGACFNPDGGSIFTWSTDGRVMIWDHATGQPKAPVIEHGRRIARFTVSRDGQRCLTVDINADCQVWNAATGMRSGKAFTPSKFLTHVDFSRDGSRVVTADDYGVARIWDATAGEPVTPPLQTSAFLFRAAFSPDGSRLITAGQDRLPKIWDASNGGLLRNLVGHKDTCSAAVFSPDGKRAATGNKDQTVRVWDAETGRLVSPVLSHSAYVETVEFNPDGNQLVTACDDGTVRLWALGVNDLPFRPWPDESPRILTVTDDGRRLLTQDKDKRVQVWDCSTWQAVGSPLIESNDVFMAALGLEEQQLLAVGGANSGEWALSLWDVASGRRLTSTVAPAGLLCVPWVAADAACVAILRTNAVEVLKLATNGATPPSSLLPQATGGLHDIGLIQQAEDRK
jgi:WD40 repeat protein